MGLILLAALRVLLLLVLIPTWGLLAYFVHVCTPSDGRPFASALYLFVVALLTSFWCLALLFCTALLRRWPWLPAPVDILLAAVIGGGLKLLDPYARNTVCDGISWDGTVSDTVKMQCYMYKSAYALGMVSAVLLVITAIAGVCAAWCGGKCEAAGKRQAEKEVEESKI